MNADFLDALRQIEKEKEIPLEVLLETIQSALVTAYKKNYATTGDVRVSVVATKAGFKVFCQKDVVETVENVHGEMTIEEARKYDPEAQIGSVIEIEVTPENFGRIAAQTAKQVVVQRIREAEREKVYEEFNDRVGEVVTGTVQHKEQRNVYINLGRVEALLPPAEQAPNEPYRFNDRVKVYLLEVRRTPRGPQVVVSRTHPSLIRRLFELEVPEISEGIVSIKSVAREPGARTKIAVASTDEKVDPVGACVGHRGSRVQAVVNEVYDEKIDIVRWNADATKFISESLSPAKASSVTVDEDTKTALVIVPDSQLSLAIGKSGQNVRLAARLTGWRIDIRSEAQIARAALTAEPFPEGEEELAEAVESSDAVVAEPAIEVETSVEQVEEPVMATAEETADPVVQEAPKAKASKSKKTEPAKKPKAKASKSKEAEPAKKPKAKASKPEAVEPENKPKAGKSRKKAEDV
ncbi:MAG: transcription termination factor NusA [Armatimonadota bacterium]|nr:transcription termination factor NusA [Armatimonadota bacterium]